MLLDDAFDGCYAAPGKISLYEAHVRPGLAGSCDGGVGTAGLCAEVEAVARQREAHPLARPAVVVRNKHAHWLLLAQGNRTFSWAPRSPARDSSSVPPT